MNKQNFHASDARKVLNSLGSSEAGLSDAVVEEKRRQHGWNEIPEAAKMSWILLFLKQFKSLLVFILMVAATISWFTDHEVDAFVILGIVIINAIIGFTQEFRAEKAVASLKQMLVLVAKVWRNGELVQLPARELVPGDIIFLEEGDNIPADARIIESNNLRTIEASLTGESLPAGKNTDTLPTGTLMGDRKNMIWKSTFVAGGTARAVVTGIGLNTAIGNIAQTITDIKAEPTNFQKKTKTLARQMAIFAIGYSFLLFCIGYFIRKMALDEIFIFTIAAMVSAIPEGLPAILSIVLAIGAWRMTQRKAIIREFTATETLGAITTILTDKTGTLTQNSLTVKKVMIPENNEYEMTGEGWHPEGEFMRDDKAQDIAGDQALQKLLLIAAFSNNSGVRFDEKKGIYEMIGDPTEGALHVLARKAGINPKKQDAVKKLYDLPFNSVNKFRATMCELQLDSRSRKEIFVVGAPEKILELSDKLLMNGSASDFNAQAKQQIQNKIDEWSASAMRVIALAYKEANTNASSVKEEEINGLVFAGITGMIDPPRPEAREAVLKCREAGIRVIMATGDHIKTAIAIAKDTGIIAPGEEKKQVALSEQQVAALSDSEFDDAIMRISVYARLSPNMKLRIATRLQEMGQLIAMTGDGVNDAPALKKADVGIAMGIMGTDVARDAAQVVLADDNFATIVSAVEEGRIVFANTRQASFFLLTTNFAEMLTLITTLAAGLPLPLTATQILWINLVTDGTVGIALATEPGHGDVLKEKPIRRKENILNLSVLPFLLINALVMTTLALIAFKYYLPFGEEKARTAVFLVLVFTQIFNMLNMRSLKESVFKIGIFSNRYVNIALLLSVALQISVVEIPFLKNIFRLHRIDITELAVIIAASSLVLWGSELYKFATKKFRKTNRPLKG